LASTFFNSLNTVHGLTTKIPGDQSQLNAACPTCTGLKLFSDEAGSGNEGGNFTSFLPTQAQAVYMMAESIQALQLNLPNLDYFSYESTGNSAWFGGSAPSDMRPVFQLYSYFFNNTTMGKTYNTSISGTAAPSLYSVVEQSATVATSESLLVANANTSTSYSLSIGTGFPSTGSVVEYYWSNATPRPVVSFLNGTPASPIAMPGESILELVWSTNPILSNQFPGGCQFSSPGSGTYTPMTGGTVTFTSPNIAAGSGGVNAHASASTPSVHELAGQWITLDCVKPSTLPGFSSSSGKISISVSYLYVATVTLTTTCSGGTATAAGNSSVEAYVYGGSTGGRSGTTQMSLFSYSKTCASNVTYVRSTGTITTGWANYVSGSWVDFHFVVWAGASAYGFPNGNGASATDSIRYTATSISMSFHA
jgi:hypothetical protein